MISGLYMYILDYWIILDFIFAWKLEKQNYWLSYDKLN